jgi:hypothetical protein
MKLTVLFIVVVGAILVWWLRSVKQRRIDPQRHASTHGQLPDYYSVISRAVAALEINNFEDRRAIYNRARAVQSQQLGKRPFSKAEFDRERSMLEDTISRVETEATTKRIITDASPSAPVHPSDIGPTPMTALPSVRSWLKSVLRRLWRD